MSENDSQYNVYYYPMASLCHGCERWKENYNNGSEPFTAVGECSAATVPYGEGCLLHAVRGAYEAGKAAYERAGQ